MNFNTLVQSGTDLSRNRKRKHPITVRGDGTEISNVKVLKGRAKKKMITQKLTRNFIDIAKRKNQLNLIPSYWNTFHCQGKMQSSGDRLYGKYCKNRFCTVCSGIRKAEIINKYLPEIEKWENPFFVTLTVRAVAAKNLEKWIKEGVMRAFHLINEKYRKRNQRGKGLKLMGIKSLECNYNPKRKSYNPHLHIIVPNEEIADALIREWMLQWKGEKGGYVSIKAQHKRRVEDRQKDLIEIIKYGSKIFTEHDTDKKSKKKGSHKIHVAALYNIFCAMKGCRIFERFGFDLPKSSKSRSKKISTLFQYDEWDFDPKINDWRNTESGQPLTGYLPPAELMALLNDNIDSMSE